MRDDDADDVNDDEPDLDSRELPDESDADDDDNPELVPCPHCGALILEDAELCPRCHNYISREDAPPERKSTFIVIIVLLLVASLAGIVWWFK